MRCPVLSARRLAISGGTTSITGDGGVWASEPVSDRSGWIGGGEDLGLTGGTLTIYALCVPGGQVVAAGNRRARARRQEAALLCKKMRAEPREP
jgi:hypothetical protein